MKKNAMNLRNVRTVRDSGARSAIKPAQSSSWHPKGSVRSAREPGVFIAGSPGGQNQRASTIDPPFFSGEFCIHSFWNYALFKPFGKIPVRHTRNKVPHEFGIC